jgi:hypothetical protein
MHTIAVMSLVRPAWLDRAFSPCVSGRDGLAIAIYVRAYMHGECFWQIEIEALSDPMELGKLRRAQVQT